MSVCPNIFAMDSKETLFAIASDANVCLAIWEIIDEASGYRMVS